MQRNLRHEDARPDPDALLAGLQREEHQKQAGKLFIFLGMCPGVGKTYAMLQAARQRVEEGLRVLVGIVETHGRHETAALVEGMNVLVRKKLDHRGFVLEEFDIDAVLRCRPDLVLVDELAHSNAPGSRHAKRCQDVVELIDAGIDVYTTLNVQHIESQVDIVRQITGVAIQETVPDSILDRAHEIQLIDLSVEKLLDRMADGKVYLGERAETAAQGFFKEGNLTALREMALRFTAEHVDRDLEDIRRSRRVSTAWKTNARLMVGVGSSPYAESLIRWTRRASTRLNCPWLVVWVEGSRPLTMAEQDRLSRSLGLARKLGGEVISVTGDNVSTALLRVARERNVSQMVVGKPEHAHPWRRSLADQLILGSGDIDVCVVRPLAAADKGTVKTAPAELSSTLRTKEYGMAVTTTLAVAMLCWVLLPLTGYTVVALVFLITVVLSALKLSQGPVLLMATASALAWDFFFIPPQYTLHIDRIEDMVMFGMFFIVAISMGSLTTRLRQGEQAERSRQRQTAALLRVTQSAALAAEPDKGLAAALRVIDELLQGTTALIVRESDRSLPKAAHAASTFEPSPKEWGVIAWSYANKLPAGRFTDTLPQSEASWFPLQTATSMMGVLGIRLPDHAAMDFTMRQTMEAFALQLALVLEKEHFIMAVRHAEVVAQSEKLHRTLLDSVSHELKTPLAVIQASLEGLGAGGSPYVDEIRTASRRLQRVVDSLLQMSRLESEMVQPCPDWCDLRDVIASARDAAGHALNGHPLAVAFPFPLPLVRLDHRLLAQALANILHNAAVYTPPGTAIDVSAGIRDGRLRLAVRDHGPGLPKGEERRVFEKFYRSPGSPAGGTGLGLAIARGFARAQGGDISAANHPEGGAEFVIDLKVDQETQADCKAVQVAEAGGLS
ncbi:MAG: Osmosensitive channel signal transduction histidine kinase [Verrucomicrobiaceae bacterium]|nr:Osmosensitive channel signal transduction histidine kinase [Verrucomicrobiaceae bacterium]